MYIYFKGKHFGYIGADLIKRIWNERVRCFKYNKVGHIAFNFEQDKRNHKEDKTRKRIWSDQCTSSYFRGIEAQLKSLPMIKITVNYTNARCLVYTCCSTTSVQSSLESECMGKIVVNAFDSREVIFTEKSKVKMHIINKRTDF